MEEDKQKETVSVIVDLPPAINKEVRVYMAEKDVNAKAEAIINILAEFFKVKLEVKK